AKQGAQDVVTDLYANGAGRRAEDISHAGGKAKGMKVDGGREEDLAQMVEAAMSNFGRLDVLCNDAVNKNPDTARDVDFLNFSEDLFQDNMRVNVLGGVLACKHALPHMLEQGQG